MRTTAPDLMRLLTRHAVAFGLFSFVVTLLLLVPTVYMLQVYDRVLPSRNETTLLVLTGLVFLLYGLMVALENVRSAVCARLAAQVDALLAPEVFAAAVRPAAGQPPQLLAADLATLRQAIAGPLPALAFDLPLGAVFVVVAAIVDPLLGGFVAFSIALLVGLALWQERRLRAPLKQAQLDAALAQQALHEASRQGETVRALGLAPRLGERWQALHDRASAQQLQAGAEAGRIGALQRFARLATQSLALGLGAWLVLEQRITPGMMMASSLLLGRALQPWEGLIQQGRSLAALRESWPRLCEALARPAAPVPLELPEPRGALRAEGLGLSLDGETELLAGLDFEVAPGEVVAVVGPSGAGKSTLARLLCGGMEPTRGCVRLDGATLAQWPAARRTAAIGVLPQDVQFFDATVAENIARLAALDDDETARTAVVRAAQAAGVHELILRLPEGYQTRLGPQGIQLSGGQRQRLALARALYGEPAVLVLDEPNAHLDEPGEQALRAALEAHKQAGRSAVVITHRHALLAVADRVLLLRGGRIAAIQARPALRTA
jgi:ATP-binding cassette, subfamily C, bacterial exporter for protease/lipase